MDYPHLYQTLRAQNDWYSTLFPPAVSAGTTTPEPESWTSDTKLVWVVMAVALVVAILIGLGACVCHKALSDRRKTPRGEHQNVPYYIGNDSVDDWRNLRIATPPKRQSSQREFIPQLDRISESPEDRFWERMGNKSAMSDGEMMMHSNLSGVPLNVSHVFHSPCSPIIPFADTSQSFPNLSVRPQAPFSPYHLAWCNAAGNRSDPNITIKSGIHGSLRPVHLRPDTPHVNKTWKSPQKPTRNPSVCEKDKETSTAIIGTQLKGCLYTSGSNIYTPANRENKCFKELPPGYPMTGTPAIMQLGTPACVPNVSGSNTSITVVTCPCGFTQRCLVCGTPTSGMATPADACANCVLPALPGYISGNTSTFPNIDSTSTSIYHSAEGLCGPGDSGERSSSTSDRSSKPSDSSTDGSKSLEQETNDGVEKKPGQGGAPTGALPNISGDLPLPLPEVLPANLAARIQAQPAGTEGSYIWDSYPFYQQHESSSTGNDPAMALTGYPMLKTKKYWV